MAEAAVLLPATSIMPDQTVLESVASPAEEATAGDGDEVAFDPKNRKSFKRK